MIVELLYRSFSSATTDSLTWLRRMGVFYLANESGQFGAFWSAVVATRPDMPSRLGKRHLERLTLHVLGSRFKCSIRMIGRHQF